MNDKTKTKLLDWANQQIKETPTRKSKFWDAQKQTRIEKETPNTIELELADILGQHQHRDYEEYKPYELIEIIADINTRGVKGYYQMALDELIKAIDELIECWYADVVEGEMSLFKDEDPAGEAFLNDEYLFQTEVTQ
jgi:hypothetical protein